MYTHCVRALVLSCVQCEANLGLRNTGGSGSRSHLGRVHPSNLHTVQCTLQSYLPGHLCALILATYLQNRQLTLHCTLCTFTIFGAVHSWSTISPLRTQQIVSSQKFEIEDSSSSDHKIFINSFLALHCIARRQCTFEALTVLRYFYKLFSHSAHILHFHHFY